jgi:hypothetical protein
MPSLEGLLADLDSVEVKWRNEVFRIDYKPGQLTGERLAGWAAKLREISSDEEFMPAYAANLAEIIVGWDVTETADGEPLPVTAAQLNRLPHALLREIERAIQAGQRPGESPGTSPVGLGQARSRTGTS